MLCFSLAGCELTEMCWETVVSALEAENSVLTELDLSDNYRVEKGAKLLSDGLRSSHCKLEVLRSAMSVSLHPEYNTVPLLRQSGPKFNMRNLCIKLKLNVMFTAFFFL